MRIPRILLANSLADSLGPGPCELDAEAAHHLLRVLRRRVGDAVIVCDGAGHAYQGRIESVEGKRCRVLLEHAVDEQVESPLRLRLGIALLRGERMDHALQKSCELGVDRIDLLLTDRVEVRLDGRRLDNRMRHYRGVLTHALQQSGRTRLPALTPPQSIEDWLTGLSGDGRRLVMDPEGVPLGANAEDAPAAVTLVTGPEGGLNPGEVDRLAAAGFERVRLGPRVLRAETAPVAALSILQWLYGDLAR